MLCGAPHIENFLKQPPQIHTKNPGAMYIKIHPTKKTTTQPNPNHHTPTRSTTTTHPKPGLQNHHTSTIFSFYFQSVTVTSVFFAIPHERPKGSVRGDQRPNFEPVGLRLRLQTERLAGVAPLLIQTSCASGLCYECRASSFSAGMARASPTTSMTSNQSRHEKCPYQVPNAVNGPRRFR